MPVAMEDVVRMALKGAAEAQRDYDHWTGGRWLWEAPEYLLTVYIARAISRIKGPKFYLTLENNVSSAIEDAGGWGRGRPRHKLRPKGRYDILLWWGNEKPRAVIEVKSPAWSFSYINQDLEKVCAVLGLKKKTSIRTGLIVFYISNRNRSGDGAQARISMQRKLEDIERDTKIFVQEHGMAVKCHKSSVRTDYDSTWVAVALEIKRMGAQS